MNTNQNDKSYFRAGAVDKLAELILAAFVNEPNCFVRFCDPEYGNRTSISGSFDLRKVAKNLVSLLANAAKQEAEHEAEKEAKKGAEQ